MARKGRHLVGLPGVVVPVEAEEVQHSIGRGAVQNALQPCASPTPSHECQNMAQKQKDSVCHAEAILLHWVGPSCDGDI